VPGSGQRSTTRECSGASRRPPIRKRLSRLNRYRNGELVLLFIGLGILYFVLLVVLGVRTFQNKHYVLFALGFFIPVIWIVGAMLPPKGMSHVDELYARRGETD
jgi:hypothetical protein